VLVPPPIKLKLDKVSDIISEGEEDMIVDKIKREFEEYIDKKYDLAP
jgi:hypothetical protein